MTHRFLPLLQRGLSLVLLAGLCLLLADKGSSARLDQLQPSARPVADSGPDDYIACRKTAFTHWKRREIDSDTLKAELAACKERYPNAELYIACKKKTVEALKTEGLSPEEAISKCRKYELMANFDTKDPLTVFIEQKVPYFAGVSMSTAIKAAQGSVPNFDCSDLEAAATKPLEASYLLIGNHPKFFGKLARLTPEALARKLGVPRKLDKKKKKGGKPFVDVAEFGRIFGDTLDSPDTLAYFPMGSCVFTGSLGRDLLEIKIFYLAETRRRLGVPYFGITFYNNATVSVPAQDMAEQLVRILGPKYRLTHKDDRALIVSSSPIAEFDSEGDPKNLCGGLRDNDLVGIFRLKADAKKWADFFLLASIKNLCDYGDRMAARLIK